MRRHNAPPTRSGSPSPGVSAAELVARIRAAQQPVAAAVTSPPVTAAAPPASTRPAPVAGPVPVAGPIPAAALIARFAATQGTAPSTRSRHRHGAGATAVTSVPRRSPAEAVPALAAPRRLRVVARPVLAAAAVLITVAAIEVPHLTSSSPTTAAADTAQIAGAPSTAASSTAPTATSTSTYSPNVDTLDPAKVSASRSAVRVSRSTRRSTPLTPAMKPGQTVPGIWVKPNNGPMTSCFCMRWGVMHEGIDLAGPLGSSILAVGDGVVLQAGPAEGFGNWVVIQQSNGDVTIYGHMRYYFVHAGEKVKAGQKIALVGAEGQATGPHLHFEVHKGSFTGPPIDPVPWLKARGISVGPYLPND